MNPRAFAQARTIRSLGVSACGQALARAATAELRWRAWPGKLGARIQDVQDREVAEMIAGLWESPGCVALIPTNDEGLERPAL